MNETSRPLSPAIEYGAYVLVALVGISGAFAAGRVVGDGVDLFGTLWFYWWIQDCLLALRDPGFTDLFFFPMGKDIFAHTGNNFVDAVLAAPLYWIFGNPGYQKWAVFAILLTNALSFRVLARHVLRTPGAVFLATLSWELNPFVLFELSCGRLTQACLVFVPLALVSLLRMETSNQWRHPVLLGLFTAACAWTYWFMGWFLAFTYAWLIPYALWTLWKAEKRVPWRLAGRFGLAGLVCLLAVGPALYAMSGAVSSGVVPGLGEAVGSVSLFEPPPSQRNNVSTYLYGLLVVEQFGVPLLTAWPTALSLVLWLVLGGGRARWLPVFVIIVAFAVGPVIGEPSQVVGRVGAGDDSLLVMPHYMAAYHYLPYFERLWFPYRMTILALLVASLGLGFVVDRLASWRPAWLRWMPAMALALWAALGVERARFDLYPFTSRDVLPPRAIQWMGDLGGAIIDLPYGVYKPAVIWQTFHGQPMFGGMGENAAMLWPDGMRKHLRNSFIHALVRTTRTPHGDIDYELAQRHKIEAEGFRWVVLHRDLVVKRGMDPTQRPTSPQHPQEQLSNLLGPPVAVDGPLVIWDLQGTAEAPAAIRASAVRLAAPVVVEDPRPAYEIALEETGRLPKRRGKAATRPTSPSSGTREEQK